MSSENCCCSCCCSCTKAGCVPNCSCRQANLVSRFEQEHHPQCHKQLNQQFARTGTSYKIKENRIQTNGCCSNAKSHHLWSAKKGGVELANEIHDSNDRLIAHMSADGDCCGQQRPHTSCYHATLQNYYRYHDHCNTVARTGFSRNLNGGFYRRC